MECFGIACSQMHTNTLEKGMIAGALQAMKRWTSAFMLISPPLLTKRYDGGNRCCQMQDFNREEINACDMLLSTAP